MKDFYRSRKYHIIGGVCGGIAEYFDIAPNIVRLGAVFIACCTAGAPFIITYIIALLFVPFAPKNMTAG